MTTARVQFGITRPGVCLAISNVGQRLRPCLSQGRFYALTTPASRHEWRPQPGSTLELQTEGLGPICIEPGENRVKLPKKPRRCGVRPLSALLRRRQAPRVLGNRFYGRDLTAESRTPGRSEKPRSPTCLVALVLTLVFRAVEQRFARPRSARP